MSSSTKSRPASSSASNCEQFVAELVERPARLPASWSRRRRDSSAVGVDHAEHCFGLGQIEPAGEEGPQREFAGFGEAGTGSADGVEQALQEWRRAERVEFGDRLAGVAAVGRPEEEVAGKIDWCATV